MGVLVRGGTVVTSSSRWRGDVRVTGETITALGPELAAEPGDRVLDADGLLVLPGAVDPHVHLSLPVAGTVSADDFRSGSLAALAGGTTTIVDFVHGRRDEPLPDALALRLEEASDSMVDFGLHVAVTDWRPGTASEMEACVAAGCPSFKVYLAYRETVGIDDDRLVRVLARAAELGATVLCHAEHGALVELLRERVVGAGIRSPVGHPRSRPAVAEAEATGRVCALAEATGTSLYIVHVTCADAVAAVAAARARGVRVTGESCPQYLVCDESIYEAPTFERAATGILSPPLRTERDQEVLWRELGRTIEVVSTDHCPFTAAQKAVGRDDFRLVPGGAAGLEHRLSILYTHGVRTGRLSLERLVDLVATAPARTFGLYPSKGTIAPGCDADLVVWDPSDRFEVDAASQRSSTDLSLYQGMELWGRPRYVLSRGELCFSEGECLAATGRGRFVPRST